MRLASVHRGLDGWTIHVNGVAVLAALAIVAVMRVAWLLGGLGR